MAGQMFGRDHDLLKQLEVRKPSFGVGLLDGH